MRAITVVDIVQRTLAECVVVIVIVVFVLGQAGAFEDDVVLGARVFGDALEYFLVFQFPLQIAFILFVLPVLSEQVV